MRDLDRTGLILYAGTNQISAAVAAAHHPQLSARVSCGPPGDPAKTAGFAAVPQLEVLEVLAARAVAATMGAHHADVRVPSATLANLAAYAGLSRPGATIAALPTWAGGHFSHREQGAAGIRGHRVVDIPFNPTRQDVDLDALPSTLAAERPALVILGGAVQLFPNDVGGVVEIAHEHGARVLFDASHPAGLIPGG
ncbi:MAG: glycine hydroxymethyltransferase, partial [Actinobacteria bacterium]|nr:glycine hydroxymethyltransferase [Actinomycetota bacterium]